MIRLCRPQRRGAGTVPGPSQLVTRRKWVSSTMQSSCYPGRDPVPIAREAVWASGPV